MTMHPEADVGRRPGLPVSGPTSPIGGAIADDVLITAARGGDLYAWELLVRRYQGFAFRYAYLTTRDPNTAEGITRTALIRAYRGLGSWEPETSLRPHLMRVVAGAARTRTREMAQRRDARPIEQQPVVWLPADPLAPSPVRVMPTPLEHDALVDAFDRLGDDDRVVLASRYALGLSRSEIAAYLGVVEEDMDGRLCSALGRLRSYLAEGVTELPGHHFGRLGDDDVGVMATRAMFADLPWKPDLAPGVTERLARDAAAYPEQFAIPPSGNQASPSGDGPAGSRATETAAVRPRVWRRSPMRLGAAALGLAAVVAVMAGSALIGDQRLRPPQPSVASGDGLALVSEAAEQIATPPETALAGPVEAIAIELSDTERPAWTIVEPHRARDGTFGARVELDWPTSAGAHEVARTQLERRLNGGDWKAVVSAEAGTPIDLTFAPGKRYDLRIRSLDADDNVLASQRFRVRLAVRDWDSSHIDRTPGHWRTTNRGALASTSTDAGITTSFSGTSVALIAPIGPAGGAMRIRVDDGDWVRGSLNESEPTDRAIVFSRDLEDGKHSLDVAVDEGTITLDSMMFVRAAEV